MISQATLVTLKAYPQKGKDAALVAPAGLQLGVFSVRAENNSGGASHIGVVRKFADQSMKLFSFDGTDYEQIALPVGPAQGLIPAVNGNGFVLQSKIPSGLIGLSISQADGTGATYVYQYWDGDSWETLTTLETIDFENTGDSVVAFQPPLDWAPGGHADLDPAMYSIRVVATTAGADAVEIDEIWAGQLLELFQDVANHGALEVEFYADRPFIMEGNEGIMPYFSNEHAANGVRIAYATL